MKVIIIIVLLSFSFILGSCAQFLGHLTSTSIQGKKGDEVSFLVPGEDFMIVSGDEPKVYGHIEYEYDNNQGNNQDYDHDKGMRTPASSMTKARPRARVRARARAKELAIKERRLGLFEEQEYMKARTYLNGISEKIYYLSLPPSERRDYITSKIGRKKERERDSLSTMIQGLGPDALYLGMDKKTVLRKWGHPTRMEVARDPKRQNECWSFYYNGHLRHVYFESGRVRGWNIDR